MLLLPWHQVMMMSLLAESHQKLFVTSQPWCLSASISCNASLSFCINIMQCQPVTVKWGRQVEEHMVDGKMKQLLVHRKGSTRAFPPHHPLIPVDYQLTGQPVLIGGTMGTNSYVLTGAPPSPSLATLKLLTLSIFRLCYMCSMMTCCACWLTSR
jgi:hypothetical protein